MLILGFADYAQQGRQLADCLGVSYKEIAVHRFPDGESRVTVPVDLPEHVVLCRSLNQPNNKLVETLLAVQTARLEGARRLTLVAPYLCYMRQDAAFQPGDAVSQHIVGGFLGNLFDDIITVDPHLHRIQRLEQAIPGSHAITLTAAKPLADFLISQWDNPLLIGPDSESEQWVSAIAKLHGLDFAVATKQRFGDRDVRITLPDVNVGRRVAVLVDDMASTGHTLIQAAEELRHCHALSVKALITHALINDETMARLAVAGIEFVGSTDSVTHRSNVVALAPLLARALQQLPGI